VLWCILLVVATTEILEFINLITDGGRVSLPEAAIAKIKVCYTKRGGLVQSRRSSSVDEKSPEENDADILEPNHP
jgi:hypothetical protein